MTNAATHASRAARYAEFLASHGIRFGFPAEIAMMATRTKQGVQNDTPPEVLWGNILPTVHLVEQIRERFGPTTIHSAYRSVPYNLAVTTSKDSQHSHNRALDFSCASGKPSDWHRALRLMRDAGEFRGGLGLYATFVHVDTRGTNADWVG
jgi:uncharacterized protein YcbK (DUF882 family)